MYPLVSVLMLTYNHEKYIRQSLESVVMQQTNFPFEVVIGEDCSVDDTRNIIQEFEKKYPHIIKPIYHNINVGVKRNAYEFCYPKLKGKYIAYLEGDDYWTDPLKLQKQADFLEKNSDYSICWTKYKTLEETEETYNGLQKELSEPYWGKESENKQVFNIDLNNIFNPYNTLTLTAMFYTSTLNLSLLYKMKNAKDNTVYCLSLIKGKGGILNFFGGVYRMHKGGSYSSLSLFNQRYSNFLNIEEIIKLIPGCNNSNLKSIRNYLLIDSYNIATSDSLSKAIQMNILKLYPKVVLYAPLKEKLKATKKLFRPLKISIKNLNFFSSKEERIQQDLEHH